MKVVCFPQFYYLSEVSRLVEIGLAVRALGQEVVFFTHGGKGNPFRESFFSLEELQAYIPAEAGAFRQGRADAVLIGWNLPAYLSAPLAGIPILVHQPGPFTAPFFDCKMGVFQPSLFGAAKPRREQVQ